MKNVLIIFDKKEANLEYAHEVSDFFKQNGISFDSAEMLSDDDESGFKTRLFDIRMRSDNIIALVGDDIEFDFKNAIAEIMDTELVINERAEELIERISEKTGEAYPSEYSMMPIEAMVIPNEHGAFQGFMIEDRDFSFVVLPKPLEEMKKTAVEYVVPYFKAKYPMPDKFIFKYFGSDSELLSILDRAKVEFQNAFDYSVKEKFGDCLVSLEFIEKSESVAAAVKRFIVEPLKENIYAEFDTTLAQRMFDLLKLKDKKISVAESFTGGRVISSIISNAGASAYVDEGVVTYSNGAKKRRLGVKDEDLKRVGAVSTQVAFQMAAGLLLGGECDIALSTTGIAGPKSDDTQKPVGLCYIGVGTREGVHVYKYNFKGDRERITETAKNTALFLVIKKLKKI